MAAGQMLYTFESTTELFITHGSPDLETQSLKSRLAQENIIKFNNSGIMTGLLEAEFLNLRDEDLIKQISDFIDSMGAWISS